MATITPTETVTSSLTPSPSFTSTPHLPTTTSTPLIIEGKLNTRVNVRSGPGTSNTSLGLLEAGQYVQIISRTSDGSWYLVLYPAAPQGMGWVASDYVTLPAGTEVPLEATSTPSGPIGQVLQRLNIRSGPGTSFDTLGSLEPGQRVSLTGKNSTASWFQIEYPAGPGGHGWVTAQYVQTESTSLLPVLDDYGNIVTPGAETTSTGPFLTPTPTVGPAFPDGDSSANPDVSVTFSATGTRQIIFSSQVSAPQGDPEDWIEFTPYAATELTASLAASLVCYGNAELSVEILENNMPFAGWGSLACNDREITILLPANHVYQMRLTPGDGAGLRLVAYTLSLKNNP